MSDTISPKAPEENKQEQSYVEIPSTMPKKSLASLLRTDLGFLPVLLTLIIISVFFQIASQVTIGQGLFLTPRNVTNLMLQIATIGTVSLGAVLVLLLGEIDLSLAAVSSLCAVVMGVFSERLGLSAPFAILAGILMGALVGFINGVFIAVLRVPSFIVTLAASIGYSGLLLFLLSGQSTLPIRSETITAISNNYLPDIIGTGLPVLVVIGFVALTLWTEMRRRRAGLRPTPNSRLGLKLGLVVVLPILVLTLFNSYLGVPSSMAILVALLVVLWLVLTKTAFGRHVYAVGGNAEAARRAGINVTGIKLAVFTLASTLAAIGGILEASRELSVASQVNPTLLLNSIAAAVIGGVSLFGGQGSVWAIVLGALIIGSLQNGLDLLGKGTDVKQMIQGIVLLVAVTVDAFVRRTQARTGR